MPLINLWEEKVMKFSVYLPTTRTSMQLRSSGVSWRLLYAKRILPLGWFTSAAFIVFVSSTDPDQPSYPHGLIRISAIWLVSKQHDPDQIKDVQADLDHCCSQGPFCVFYGSNPHKFSIILNHFKYKQQNDNNKRCKSSVIANVWLYFSGSMTFWRL